MSKDFIICKNIQYRFTNKTIQDNSPFFINKILLGYYCPDEMGITIYAKLELVTNRQ